MKHMRVSYSKVALMVLRVTAMKGGAQRLKVVVADICRNMGVCLSDAAVMDALGSHVQEKVYDKEIVDTFGTTSTIRVVEDWVVYGA